MPIGDPGVRVVEVSRRRLAGSLSFSDDDDELSESAVLMAGSCILRCGLPAALVVAGGAFNFVIPVGLSCEFGGSGGDVREVCFRVCGDEDSKRRVGFRFRRGRGSGRFRGSGLEFSCGSSPGGGSSSSR